jgi:GAF domain-containing protein
MKDEGGHDPLQDLFSSDGPEELEDLQGAASLDLSTAGLFSLPDVEDERHARADVNAPIEPPTPARDTAPTQVTARREPAYHDLARSLPPSEPPAATGTGAHVAGRPSLVDDQPSRQTELEESTGPLPSLQAGNGDADWRLVSIGRELAQERRRVLNVLLAGAALVGMASLVALSLGPPLRPGQWLAFALSVAFLLASIGILYALPARVERRLRSLLKQQEDAFCAAQAVSAGRQQALERANLALGRQARHVELGAAVGRLATMGLSPDEMMARAVALIQQQVEADYVGLYLLDEDRVYANLCAQASALPELTRSLHEITRITDDVLLRQCVSSGRPRTMLGMDQVGGLAGEGGSTFLRHGIRSALALPLIARGAVFGAISVQSESPAAFSSDDLAALRNAADQVSIGVSNAQLAGELRESAAELQALQQRYAREVWDPFLASNAPSLYEYHRPGIGPLGEDELWIEGEEMPPSPRLTAFEVADPSAPSALLVPISLREQMLGVLGLQRGDGDASWTEEQLELLTAVSEQMGLVIENSRLFAEARSRAARERQAREIVARLRQSLDTEEILSTAVREMGETLGLKDVTICLTGDNDQVGG